MHNNFTLGIGEKILQSYRPKSILRCIFPRIVSYRSQLIITNKRVALLDPRNGNRQIAYGEIYDARTWRRQLNILKKGASPDNDYDINFESYEMDRPYINVTWLDRPDLAESLIESLMPEHR